MPTFDETLGAMLAVVAMAVGSLGLAGLLALAGGMGIVVARRRRATSFGVAVGAVVMGVVLSVVLAVGVEPHRHPSEARVLGTLAGLVAAYVLGAVGAVIARSAWLLLLGPPAPDV
jgi:hypothetical protein